MTLTYPTAGVNRPSSASYLRRLDWLLVGAALALSVIGSLLVWSATQGKLVETGGDPQSFLKKHLINLVVGVAFAVLISRFDYRLLRAYTPILWGLSILGLLVVLSPLGKTVNGAHAWIFLPGGLSLQPSEFAKLAIILGMSMILSEKRDAENEPRDIDVLYALGVAAVPVALIMLQPDLGTVMVIACMVFGIIAVSGAKARWLAGILVAGVLVAMLAVQLGVLKQYQVDRLTAFTNPNANSRDIGYNTQQARIAIGSGGMLGTGLFNGPQTQGRFVPENQTDFVYSVAGEELGFAGAGAIIALLGLILWRAIRIAMRAADLFGRLVATGVAVWIAFQAFENIGMNLGIMPVTGVPLPFVSYGGTSMFASWLAIGLLLNVHLRTQE
ncbi:MAG TPA: rod shape-determining protein RodA [Candidatus Nanopelagicales bacterium]|nr:rod shape-determining protein RodA [Candidatus Nanopelagicales bacterium]